jgi:hypothetical protein
VSVPTQLPTAQLDVSHLLEFFDTDVMAVREAKYMQHNVSGIQVTADTVEDMLSSIPDEEASQNLARDLPRSVLSSLACIITAETLNAIESLWTERD